MAERLPPTGSGGDRPRAGTPADRAFHARLQRGDAAAPSDLIAAYLGPLVRRLERGYPRADPHQVESACTDALLDLAEHPHRYDPARASLAGYLYMSARGDLLNALKREQRRGQRERSHDPVELADLARNVEGEEGDPAELVVQQEQAEPAWLAQVRAAFDDQEWAVVQLMVVEGERRTRVFAALLGLQHLAQAEQERAVKHVKDRLTKRLQRLAPRIDREG